MRVLLFLAVCAPAVARRRLEPPAGRTIHAAGQEPGAFEAYSSFMGALGPAVSMFYFGDFDGLNSTPRGTVNPWFSALRVKLDADGASDGAFLLPQLGLQLPLNGGEAAVANGSYDAALETLRVSLLALERPVFLRVGYEFNGPWNGYKPQSYIGAFRRIASVLHGDPILNLSVALVWDGSCDTSRDPTPFFPGDDVVDWQGINLFTSGSAPLAPLQSCVWYWLTDSRAGGYPLMIGESTPRGLFTSNASTWEKWHAVYLALVKEWAPALISYIDEDWEAVPRWVGWGDSRIEKFEPVLAGEWKAALGGAQYANRMGRAELLALLGVPDLWVAGGAPASASVTSTDGLTTLTIDGVTGFVSSVSAPGHAPLALAPGSGSFIGYGGGISDGVAPPSGVASRVYPSAVIAPCNASDDAQRFTLLPTGRIVSADATHCLDVWDCGRTNGTVIDLYPCFSGATCGDATQTLNELFSLDPVTGALSSALAPPNTLCVDVLHGSGPTVNLWACTGGANQAWHYDATTRLFESVGNPGMCLSAPPSPPPPPPPPPPCNWVGAAIITGGAGATPVTVSRNATCLRGEATVLVVDTFTPASTSVSWVSTYTVLAALGDALPAFTVPLGASLRLPTPTLDVLSLWTTWTRGCVDNGPGMCFGDGAWREPFSSIPLAGAPPTLFKLGDRGWGQVFAPFGRSIDDSITVPLVSLQRAADDFGVTLLLSPDEPLLEVLLRVDEGGVSFARLLRRLVTDVPVVVTAHIRAHAADWRPALQLLLDTHPLYVLPHAENTSDFDGLGGYSWLPPLNASYAASVGFQTNWELSGTFMPYDGLFAPYADEWENLGPINAGLPHYNVTYATIDAFDASVRAVGLSSLSYFDIGNWGVSIDTSRQWPNLTCGLRPSGAPAPCPTPIGSNAFLQHFLSDALLDEGWSVTGGPFSGAKSDWVGTTLMDPSEPFFEDLLLEQLNRRLGGALVPSAQGIAIDRFDYSQYYSYKRDDGVSWVPLADGSSWGPAHSLLVSHTHTYARLAAALRAASPTKVMFGNCNTLCRIDLGGLFDGGFSEGAALNAVAWLGLRRPSILWTYSLSALSPAGLDAYFQQHLLMRTFPMAPMPGNDHSITPGSASVQAAYEDYAPLFLSARGCEWVLDAVRPVSVSGGGPTVVANVFRAMGTTATPTTRGELLVVVVLGGDAQYVAVTLSGEVLLGAASALDVSVLVPGGGAWEPLGRVAVVGARAVVGGVRMGRGACVLRAVVVAG